MPLSDLVLLLGVGNRLYQLEDIVGVGFCKALWCGEGLEEGRGNKIYALVGALCRQDYGHQELVGVGEFQFGGSFGHLLCEAFDNGAVSFFSFHFRRRCGGSFAEEPVDEVGAANAVEEGGDACAVGRVVPKEEHPLVEFRPGSVAVCTSRPV